MKSLRTVTFYWNSDQYERKTEVVSVEASKTSREVMEAWINSQHSSEYVSIFTSNWTKDTFYDISDNCVHMWSVEKFVAKEL